MFENRFGGYTRIQEKAISIVKSGADALIIAPTGTGKTESAFLPVLDNMLDMECRPITVLYITPLRSLNRDLIARLRGWAEPLGYRVAMRHGDTTSSERRFQLKHAAHIFITTPETLQIMLGSEGFRSYFSNIKYVIVDELHEFVSSKRGAQLSLGLSRLRAISEFQTIALSATLSNPIAAAQFALKPSFEVISDNTAKSPCVRVARVSGAGDEIEKICNEIASYAGNSKTLVFANTRYMAELIGSKLIHKGIPASVHHGSLSKYERENTEMRFKNGDLKLLICTSSLELGIDIGDVEQVVQVNSPKQARKLLQRAGRSGHSHSMRSKCLVICDNEYDYAESKVISEMAASYDVEDDEVMYACMDVLAHAITGEILCLGRVSDQQLHEIVKSNQLYSSVSYDSLRSLLSEMHGNGIIFYDGNEARRTFRTRKYYFTRASTIPFNSKYAMVSSGRTIGYLDERFILSLSEGDVFITKGKPWVVHSIEDDKIIVGPSPKYILAIPDWDGEQIPVSRCVAERVKEKLGGKFSIDVFADYMIIYTYLGSKANNALAMALANRITSAYSREVSVKSSPYAIFIRLAYPLSKQSFISILKGVNVKNEILSCICKDRAFQYIFSHESYYMGYAEGRARFSPHYISRLSSTHMYNESVKYFMHRYCDARAAQKFIDSLSDDLEYNICKELPERAKQVLSHMSGFKLMFPDIPDKAASLFLNDVPSTFRFECVNCGSSFYAHVDALPESCAKCNSVLIAPISDRELNRINRSKGTLMRRASLYRSYGRRALIALSTYGIGTNAASRILSRMHRSDKQFAMDLLRARDQFIRTKKYWSP